MERLRRQKIMAKPATDKVSLACDAAENPDEATSKGIDGRDANSGGDARCDRPGAAPESTGKRKERSPEMQGITDMEMPDSWRHIIDELLPCTFPPLKPSNLPALICPGFPCLHLFL